MPRILVTAFEPFNGMDVNSSSIVLERIKENDIIKRVLPVTYFGARVMIQNLIRELKPDFVLCLGQAGGEGKIRIEKIGINFQGASIKDNEGVYIREGQICNGPNAIFTKANTIELLDLLESMHIPAYLSLSAGGFICNTVYYTSLQEMNGNALFVHLPYAEGKLVPNMKAKEMEEAVELIINYLSK